ncbi:MAG TPA: bifunctional phosphopantothenoylcysteine decarboxylase/phosphopantothenate--cysteine ligase CoaBC [Actinomycetota bacterium]|nr:bifunctional phosphopantothenoylcysteine decarboxylase/phosphopantothenate--cysteine ligase CoaBC [Actinomycetota bacterium]
MSFARRRIVVGVSAGIAAYKVVEVARRLTQAGAEVQVVMTPAATHFVGALTFASLTGRPVPTDLFAGPPGPAEGPIVHTALARWAEAVLLAPATADLLAKMAGGHADDLLTAFLLATRAPVVAAPAMHTEMWEHPATQANAALLRERGIRLVGPAEGALAGPDAGPGRLAEPETLLAALADVLDGAAAEASALGGRRVLVTAGGTQEPLDAVRYLGNRSSGRMGYAVAAAALRRGAQVTLVSAPTRLEAPAGAELVAVRTAAEMRHAVLGAAECAEVVVMAAAVADWRPVGPSDAKHKKAEGPPAVVLEATEDILAALGSRRRPGQVLVGFAAETADPEAGARDKLAAKGVDIVVGNLVGVADSGFEVDSTRAVIVGRDGAVQRPPLLSKDALAGVILDRVEGLLAPP